MGKGEETRNAILREALDLSSQIGLEGLSFGVLAKRAGMSKSGLYAHFDTKENLQCQVLDTAAERFVDVVVAPALKQRRGLPRLQTLFENWLQWEGGGLSGGCPFVAASTEFDDRKGPVRDCLVGHLQDVLGVIARAAEIAVEVGDFRPDLDVQQFAYEFWAITLSYQHFFRLLGRVDAGARGRRAFESLLQKSAAAEQPVESN